MTRNFSHRRFQRLWLTAGLVFLLMPTAILLSDTLPHEPQELRSLGVSTTEFTPMDAHEAKISQKAIEPEEENDAVADATAVLPTNATSTNAQPSCPPLDTEPLLHGSAENNDVSADSSLDTDGHAVCGTYNGRVLYFVQTAFPARSGFQRTPFSGRNPWEYPSHSGTCRDGSCQAQTASPTCPKCAAPTETVVPTETMVSTETTLPIEWPPQAGNSTGNVPSAPQAQNEQGTASLLPWPDLPRTSNIPESSSTIPGTVSPRLPVLPAPSLPRLPQLPQLPGMESTQEATVGKSPMTPDGSTRSTTKQTQTKDGDFPTLPQLVKPTLPELKPLSPLPSLSDPWGLPKLPSLQVFTKLLAVLKWTCSYLPFVLVLLLIWRFRRGKKPTQTPQKPSCGTPAANNEASSGTTSTRTETATARTSGTTTGEVRQATAQNAVKQATETNDAKQMNLMDVDVIAK